MIYKRYEGESEEELIYRICEDKDQIGTWSDVADILNDLLNVNYSESTYRKKYSAFQKMLVILRPNGQPLHKPFARH